MISILHFPQPFFFWGLPFGYIISFCTFPEESQMKIVRSMQEIISGAKFNQNQSAIIK